MTQHPPNIFTNSAAVRFKFIVLSYLFYTTVILLHNIHYTIVGVSSDALNFKKKKRNPIYSQDERMAIISALECVDQVFLEESLELKAAYIQQYNASLLVMGDDWQDKFNDMPCAVKYLERTPSVSTTQIIETIKTI